MIKIFKTIKLGPFLLANLIFLQSIVPYQTFALTGGPSQPEVQSFEPISTNQMVDLHTGDFNYNIPLLTVPGPNGGYPINVAYHAGIGMEQEASWVGLGWNLNPGVLTRGLRGLPDDFNGNVIKKERYTKPNLTVAAGGNFGINLEIGPVGDATKNKASFGSNFALRYNNYRGLDYTRGISASVEAFGIATVGVGVSHDSETGASITPSISLSKEFKNVMGKYGLSLSKSFHSRNGALPTNFGFSTSLEGSVNGSDGNGNDVSYAYTAMESNTNYSFNVYNTSVPYSTFGMSEYSFKGSLELGLSAATISPKIGAWASFSRSSITNTTQDIKAYGYLFSEYAKEKDLHDFNRENDGVIHHDSPRLPIPMYTNDVFNASGNGIGGSFRPLRNDVAVLGDPKVESNNIGVEGSVEIGIAFGSHLGADVTVSRMRKIDGKLSTPELKSNGYDFKSDDYKKQNPNFRPYFFKSMSEMSASRVTPSGSNQPVNISSTASSKKLNLYSKANQADFKVVDNVSADEVKSANFINRDEYIGNAMAVKTVRELKAAKQYSDYSSYLFPEAGPQRWNETSLPLDGDNGYGDLIGEVSVINSSGMKYVYGLPAINHETKTYAFALNDEVTDDLDKIKKTVIYNPSDREAKNGNGNDEFYEYTKVPAYAHSFHLTAIYSTDYVDLTGDGPSEDDFGSYVSFDYTLASDDYEWRAPFKDANLAIGYLANTTGDSDKHDDKANFTYGKKQIYYLNAIKTKTHKAIFNTSTDRKDAKGVSSLDQTTGTDLGESSRKLNNIKLYVNKNNELVKTVHFKYDYELSVNTYNSSAANKGKLTLQNIWYSTGNRHGGILNRYSFGYELGDPGDAGDPNDFGDNEYNPYKIDRWGNYASTMTEENYHHAPYTNQDNSITDTQRRNKDASLWNLNYIKLPSGGEINIDYEADSYSYVQDKKAMQMYEVLGIASDKGAEGFELTNGNINKNKYLIIKPPKGFDVGNKAELIDNVSDVFFKMFLKLNSEHSDYVEGYGHPDPDLSNLHFEKVKKKLSDDTYVNINNDTECILLKLKPTYLGKGLKTHPVRAAGIRYIKNERQDLNSQSAAESLFGVVNPLHIITYLIDLKNIAQGYYKTALNDGKAKAFDPIDPISNPYYKSYVRLNSIDKKYGGGYRVKQITLNDNWSSMIGTSDDTDNTLYGQTYTYEDPNTKESFGVCSYEPMVGDEENPFKKPIYFNGDSYIVDDNAQFVEDTYGEQFQPGPSVGYSKVVVENIVRDSEIDQSNGERLTLKSGAGKMVQEYYTFKDYPVVINHSKSNTSDVNVAVPFPFIGSFTTNFTAYSQAYEVYLNDMSGKTKKVSAYASTQDVFDVNELPRTYTEYQYQDKQLRHYDGSYKTVPDPLADVMGDKGSVTRKNLGETREFYLDSRQNKSSNYSLGIAGNFDIGTLFFPAGLVFVQPQFSKHESGFSSIVSNEVINRKGILKRTISHDGGKKVITENKVYDVYSGNPIVTSVNNDQYKKTYGLSMLAHQQYPEMGAAYENLGKEVYETCISGDEASYFDFEFSDVEKIKVFKKGDLVQITDVTDEKILGLYSIYNLTSNIVSFKNYATSDSFSDFEDIVENHNYKFKVVESGNKNLLTASIGSVTSLNKNIASLMVGQHEALSWLNKLQGIDKHIHYPNPSCPHKLLTLDWYNGDERIQKFNENSVCAKYEIEVKPDIIVQSDACAIGGMQFNELLLGIKTHSDQPTDANATALIAELGVQGLPCTKEGAYYYFEGEDDINCKQKANNGVLEQHNWLSMTNLKATWYNVFPVCYDVLDANAVTYKDDWFTENDFDDNIVETTPEDDYRHGKKGMWKPYKTYANLTSRIQTDSEGNSSINPDLSVSGVYDDFHPFNWQDIESNSNYAWKEVHEVTKYSPYGFALETKNALGQYSSEIIGFNNTVPIAVANNARFNEIAFCDFEDLSGSLSGQSYGQVKLTNGTVLDLEQDATLPIHSGKKAWRLSEGTIEVHSAQIEVEKKYVLSYWAKCNVEIDQSYGIGKVYYTYNSGSGIQEIHLNTLNVNVTNPIEGWRKIEHVLSVPSNLIVANANSEGFKVKFDPIMIIGTGAVVRNIDDIRFHPFDAGFKSFVYDNTDYKVLAELDNQNFATFYNYDLNRNLFQVKKETTRGLKTLQSTRQNLPIQD